MPVTVAAAGHRKSDVTSLRLTVTVRVYSLVQDARRSGPRPGLSGWTGPPRPESRVGGTGSYEPPAKLKDRGPRGWPRREGGPGAPGQLRLQPAA